MAQSKKPACLEPVERAEKTPENVPAPLTPTPRPKKAHYFTRKHRQIPGVLWPRRPLCQVDFHI